MLTPQEIEVWYILPRIRSEIASELKSKGMTQKEIAKIMDITPAAISQYLHNKRAKKIDFKLKKGIIEKGAERIIKNKEDYSKILQNLLKKFKPLVCRIHEKVEEINNCCGLCEKWEEKKIKKALIE